MLGPGRVHRHGYRSGVQASKEGGDVIDPRMKHKQDPLSMKIHRPEMSANRPRPEVKIAVRDERLFFFPVLEEGIGKSVGIGHGPVPEDIH